MSYVRAVIQIDEPKSPDVDIYVPQRIMRKLQIPSKPISIQFGRRLGSAIVRESAKSETVKFSPTLARSLHLPGGLALMVRFDALRQTLVVGPYLGILLTTVRSGGMPFGALTSFMNECADVYQKRGGLVAAFSLGDVDFASETVRAHIRRNGQWQTYTLPLPAMIYNRLSSRSVERSESASTFLARCKEKEIPFFNERFLNKWHVHKTLQNEPAAQPYLPATLMYRGIQDLRDMCQSHSIVYVKPTNGSLGKGIYRLARTRSGYVVRTAGGLKKSFKELSQVHSFLYQRTRDKPYLLQQGLHLVGSGGKPADFRVLVQKNNRGAWSITSQVARIGQNSVVSNVARGGQMMSVPQALRILGPWRSEIRTSPQSLKSASLTIAEALERAIPGDFAEFGIDMGIDVNGRIWLLEINSKPSKSIKSLQLAEGEEAPKNARPSVRRLLDYTAYLNGFLLEKKRAKTKRKR